MGWWTWTWTAAPAESWKSILQENEMVTRQNYKWNSKIIRTAVIRNKKCANICSEVPNSNRNR